MNGAEQEMKFGRGRPQDIFWYGAAAPVTISSAAPTATAIIQMDADSYFNWLASSYFAMIAGESVPTSSSDDVAVTHPWPVIEANNLIPPVLLQITDTGSGKYLMNSPIPMGAFMGDGKNPYRLIAPRVYAPNSAIQLNFTYVGAAGYTYTLYPVLHGFKDFTGK